MENIDPLPFSTTRTVRVIKPIEDGTDKERREKREALYSGLKKKQPETKKDSPSENSSDKTEGEEQKDIGRRIDIQV